MIIIKNVVKYLSRVESLTSKQENTEKKLVNSKKLKLKMIQEKENAKEEINYDNGKKMKAFMPLEQELVSLNKPSESNPAGLRFIIRTWLSESSTHGIKNVYEADDWFLRIIWIICFLASFVYCTYLVIVTLIDYLSYPYLTSVEVIDEMPTPFPTIM